MDEPETPLDAGGDPPAPDPEPAPSPEPTESVPTEGAPGDGKLTTEALLAELRGRVERGEAKVEDVTSLANRKLQQVNSSLINKLGRFEERASRINADMLAAKGVTLPEGATSIMDLFADPDHTKFVQWWEDLPSNKAARDTRTRQELEQMGHQKIAETVKAFPELKDDIPQICQIIIEDPLMRQFSDVPEAIPLLLVGVGRDLQVQRMGPELKSTKDKLNAALKVIEENGLVVKTQGGKTTEVKSTTPKTHSAGPLSIKSIAASMYAEAARKAGVH